MIVWIQRIPSIIWEIFYSVAEQTTRSSTEKKEQHEIWGDHHYPKRASYDQKMNQTLPASASSSLQYSLVLAERQLHLDEGKNEREKDLKAFIQARLETSPQYSP